VPLGDARDYLGKEYEHWIEDARSAGLKNVRTQHRTVKGLSESPGG
jgi:hypothetical protein